MEDLLRRKGVLDRAHAAGLVTDSDYGIRLAALQADTADQLDAPAQAPAGAGPALASVAGPAFVPLGRSLAAAVAVAAVAEARRTAEAEAVARPRLDAAAAEELRRMGDCL